MVHDVLWWFVTVRDVSSWFVMFRGGSSWFMMFRHGSWCFVVVRHGLWCFVVVHHGSWCFIMVCDVLWWFVMVRHGLWCFVMVRDVSCWFVMVHVMFQGGLSWFTYHFITICNINYFLKHSLLQLIQSVVHLTKNTILNWYNVCQIGRSEQQVQFQHLLHLEFKVHVWLMYSCIQFAVPADWEAPGKWDPSHRWA